MWWNQKKWNLGWKSTIFNTVSLNSSRNKVKISVIIWIKERTIKVWKKQYYNVGNSVGWPNLGSWVVSGVCSYAEAKSWIMIIIFFSISLSIKINIIFYVQCKMLKVGKWSEARFDRIQNTLILGSSGSPKF